MSTSTAYYKTILTGGGASALDGIDGAALNDKDFAFVMVSNVSYTYQLDADSGVAESSPDVICPNTNAGDKRWILQLASGSVNSGFASPTELIISGGEITVSGDNKWRFHSIDTQNDDASDDLDTINGGNTGEKLILQAANGARTVVCKDGTSLKLQADFSLNNVEDKLELLCISSGIWHEMTRASNGS